MRIAKALLVVTATSFSNHAIHAFTVAPPLSIVRHDQQQRTFSPTSSSSAALFATENEENETNNHHFLHNKHNMLSNLGKTTLETITTLSLSAALLLTTTTTTPANAADYNSFTEEQRLISEAWRIVDQSYLDRTFNNQDWFALRQNTLLKSKKFKSITEAQTAVETMLSSLGDKYTRYLNPAKYQSLVDSATGNLCGVGVEISTNRDGSRVIASDVEPNSPASNIGILPRDVFVEVDGVRFDDGTGTPDDVASKLRGREGSKVGVVMERDGKVLDFIVTRQPIKITSVRTYVSDKAGGGVGKVGVIRIKSFSGTTASTVKDALVDLKKKGAQAFVLDLRNNPGGLLPGGVDTASLFLKGNKPVVYTVNKNGVVDAQASLADGIELTSPLVVFVNGNTASAAEVLTAALKENDRATIVGEKTFGKGVVQTIRPLSNENGGVAVTIQRYETPKRNNINKLGIAVDVPTNLEDCEGKEDAVVCIPSSAFKKPVLDES